MAERKYSTPTKYGENKPTQVPVAEKKHVDKGIDRSKSLFGVHMKTLLHKRFLTFRRDKKMWAFVVFVPALFVLLGIIILLSVTAKDEPNLEMTPMVSDADGGVERMKGVNINRCLHH